MGKMTEKVACTPLGPQTKLPQLLAVSWVCPLLMNFQVPIMTDEESPRYYALLHNTGVWATVGETPGGERPHLNTTGQLLLCSWCSWQCHLLGLQDWSTCLSTLTQLLLCLWMINVQVMSPPTSFTLLKMIKRRLLSAQAKWYSDKFRKNSLRDRFIMYQKTKVFYMRWYWINCDPTWWSWSEDSGIPCLLQSFLMKALVHPCACETISLTETATRTPPNPLEGFYLAKFRCSDWEVKGGFGCLLEE